MVRLDGDPTKWYPCLSQDVGSQGTSFFSCFLLLYRHFTFTSSTLKNTHKHINMIFESDICLEDVDTSWRNTFLPVSAFKVHYWEYVTAKDATEFWGGRGLGERRARWPEELDGTLWEQGHELQVHYYSIHGVCRVTGFPKSLSCFP